MSAEVGRQCDLVAELKRSIARNLDHHAADLTRLGDDLFEHAELAYREHRTARVIAEELRRLGLQVEEGLALTGVRARLRGGRPGPTVCVMGELDGIHVPDHPSADPETGAAHACGHHAQLVHLVATARALVESGAAEHIAGDVVFFAVPAEEYADVEWGLEHDEHGQVEFLGGKRELIRLGHFDGIDMAMMVHAVGGPEAAPLGIFQTSNGFLAKRARYIGSATHAAATPHLGINALNAATLALQAIHMQRETFPDDDHVRVHPIITHGGTAVNVVPADVVVEMLIRAARDGAISETEIKVDRALRAGAIALGGRVEIQTEPGYLPLHDDAQLGAIFRVNALALVGDEGWKDHAYSTASTDAGDLSHTMPVLHPSHGGCAGANHSPDFAIQDPTIAYLIPAKALAWTVIDLLTDSAARAHGVLATFQPTLSKAQYLEQVRARRRREVLNGGA